MGDLITVIAPVFLVMGFGYFATKREILTPFHIDGLVLFTQKFAIPCLLFYAIANLELGEYFNPKLLMSYYLPAIAMFAAGTMGAHLVFKRTLPDSVAIGFACLFSNSVLLGLPITERAYGPDSLDPNYAIIAMNAPVCYIIGIATMEIVRSRSEDSAKSAFETVRAITRSITHNALVIGIALGFAVNMFQITLPTILDDAINMMIRAALPAAVFSLGGVLAQYKIEGDIGPVLMICGLSLLVQPALSFGLIHAFELNTASLRSSVLTGAMAPGVNAYVFANMYGAAKRVVASTVLIATALSVLSISMWLAILP